MYFLFTRKALLMLLSFRILLLLLWKMCNNARVTLLELSQVDLSIKIINRLETKENLHGENSAQQLVVVNQTKLF